MLLCVCVGTYIPKYYNIVYINKRSTTVYKSFIYRTLPHTVTVILVYYYYIILCLNNSYLLLYRYGE